MADLICVRQNAYYDSVTLMTLSNKLKKMEGVQDAVVSMATDMNKELLAGINLSNSEVEAAGANDLLIAVRADSEELCQQVSEANTIIDLGDDAFTVGRPHPMIEPELRNDRLLAEALDPETAVVLLDFELGYGSHEDPAGVALEAIRAAQEKNRAAGREVLFVGYILGTDSDFQNYAAQRAALEEAGVLVAGSNLDAVRMALAAVNGR